jgi:hypothetical protein
MVFHDPELWFAVGLTQEELDAGVLPPDLAEMLLWGRDRWGRLLVARAPKVPMRPCEILATMPCEISEALERCWAKDPLAVHAAWMEELHRQVSQRAVRVSRGGRGLHYKDRVSYEVGRPLRLSVAHGRNRLDEPEHHDHSLVFGPVFMGEGVNWRTFAPRGVLEVLHREGGRQGLV